jgi:hypothetical protein
VLSTREDAVRAAKTIFDVNSFSPSTHTIQTLGPGAYCSEICFFFVSSGKMPHGFRGPVDPAEPMAERRDAQKPHHISITPHALIRMEHATFFFLSSLFLLSVK